jgi:hypothetical protein
VILYGVERDERDHDRSRGFVFLIFRVGAVVLVLADFQPAGAAEHDVDDAGIAEEGADPFRRAAADDDSGDEDTGPEDHLTEVVRAAHKTEQPGVHEAPRILLLGPVFLEISGCFQRQAGSGDEKPDDAKRVRAASVHEPECHRGRLECIENRSGDPDRQLGAERNPVVLFDFPFHASGVSCLAVPVDQIAGKPAAVEDEEYALQGGAHGERVTEKGELPGADKRHRRTVSDGNEPDIFAEAAGTGDQRQHQKNQKCFHMLPSFLFDRFCLLGA